MDASDLEIRLQMPIINLLNLKRYLFASYEYGIDSGMDSFQQSMYNIVHETMIRNYLTDVTDQFKFKITFCKPSNGKGCVFKMSRIQIGSWLYNQIQINGERTTTNVSFKTCVITDQNPTEVFITGIPYKMYEDNLIPLFETIGVVAQFRLMMNYSGLNRGFGYIIYAESNDAHRAILYLNNILVSSWCRLQLSVSRNIRQLWLGNVSADLDVANVIDLILEKVDPKQISVRQRNGRQSFLLKFATHRETALSRKLLLREILDFGVEARADWDKHAPG